VLQLLRHRAEPRDVDGEQGWRSLVETVAVVPALAGFVWACYETLMALLAVSADDFPQCSGMDPTRSP
jgi:hypothetical protein